MFGPTQRIMREQSRRSALTLRGGVMGADNSNQLDNTSAAQFSAISREPVTARVAFNQIFIDIPLWAFSASGAITETDLAESYTFGVALEYPFTNAVAGIPTNTRYRMLTLAGANWFNYTVGGQAAPYARFYLNLSAIGITISAGAVYGIWVTQECVAGRTGGVINKRLFKSQQGSSSLHPYLCNVSTSVAASSYVDTDGAMALNSISAVTSIKTGGTVLMGAGPINTAMAPGTVSWVIDGNSIEAGNQEGYGASGTYGDASGDAYANRGWAMRLAQKLGKPATQISKGSDRDSYRLATGMYNRRLAQMSAINPTHYFDMNPHNEIASGTVAAVGWAGSTVYVLDDARTANSALWICTVPGTSAASGGPSGITTLGAFVVDGTVTWMCLGAQAAITTAAIGNSFAGWVSARKKRLRMVQTAVPNAKLIGTTCPPDAASTMIASSVAYVSATGIMTVTVSTTANMLAGQNVRVSGLSPTGHNTTPSTDQGEVCTITTGTTFTVQHTTGLAAPTGTATVNTGWTTAAAQTANTGYAAGNSLRTLINQFIRSTVGQSFLGYATVSDIGKYAESGNPVTAGTETGAWAAVASSAFAPTSDGTHPTSVNYDAIATALTGDPIYLSVVTNP